MKSRCHIYGIILLVLSLAAGSICAQGGPIKAKIDAIVAEAKANVAAVTIDELANMMQSEAKFMLLDVRTQPEFEAGHLTGAKHTPRGMVEYLALLGKIGPLSGTYICYCKEDGRASLSAQSLRQLGYTDVRYLEGGLEAWAKAGKSVYNQHGECKIVDFEAKEKTE